MGTHSLFRCFISFLLL
uniref:Uncharacterized protein n=1 Tax=Rhizophora mucronata TaxID=61149 RepID=A0A2P2QQ05_RHIMU